MSHPEPGHDFENERQDDDLLRDEMDARRWWDEQDMKAEMNNGAFQEQRASPPLTDDRGNSTQVCHGLNPPSEGEGDVERLHQLEARGLNWQAHWDKREQDMRDNREFWKAWDRRYNK